MRKSILSLVAVGLSLTLLGCPPPEGGETKTDGDATSKPADGDDKGTEGDAGGEGDSGGETAPASSDPDISHVQVGQQYVYDMVAAGTKMQMVYKIKDITDGVITYETVTVMEIAGEMKEMPGAEAKWGEKVDAPVGDAPATENKSKDLGTESVKVGDMDFNCKVMETTVEGAGTTKTWSPMKPDGVMTWPMMTKSEKIGRAHV